MTSDMKCHSLNYCVSFRDLPVEQSIPTLGRSLGDVECHMKAAIQAMSAQISRLQGGAQIALNLAPLQQSKIVVNGYTDNVPVGSALQQIWSRRKDWAIRRRSPRRRHAFLAAHEPAAQ
jgi:hypothetical protein